MLRFLGLKSAGKTTIGKKCFIAKCGVVFAVLNAEKSKFFIPPKKQIIIIKIQIIAVKRLYL